MFTDLPVAARENLAEELKNEGRHVAAQQVAATIHLTKDQLRHILAEFGLYLNPILDAYFRSTLVDRFVEKAAKLTRGE